MNKSYEYLDNICLIKTNKYKTISIYFNYSKPYDLKSKLILNILTKFVGQYSNLYNSKQAMGKAVDMLYGASLQSSVKVKANLLLFNIKYSFINPRFLNDLNIEDFLEYMDECLHNVYFSKDLLNEFKKVYKDTVARVLDNPKNYAKNQVVKLIGQKEENFLIYDLDHVNEIDAISLEDIKNVYENLLKDFSCDIYVVGDFDDELIKHLEKYKSPCRFSLMNKPIEIEDIGEVIEEKDISQSCLNIVYTNNNNRLNKDFYAYVLGDVLFGVVPTSLLFEEVREHLSLCYQISVINYKNEGISKVMTLFDKKNKDTIIAEVERQKQKLINKDYDFSKLDSARALIIDSLNSTLDDNDDYVDYLYYNKLNGIDVSLDDYKEELMKVSVDDIARVFKNYKHVLTYTLKGVKNEEEL